MDLFRLWVEVVSQQGVWEQQHSHIRHIDQSMTASRSIVQCWILLAIYRDRCDGILLHKLLRPDFGGFQAC